MRQGYGTWTSVLVFLFIWLGKLYKRFSEHKPRIGKESVLKYWNKDVENIKNICFQIPCLQEEDIRVKIMAGVQFENGTIPARWMKSSNFYIRSLTIDMALLNHIENDAFNTLSLRYLFSLTMSNLAMFSLGPRTFTGLENLSSLELRSSRIIDFPAVLSPLANTLRYLLISGNDISRSHTQSIDELSNGISMPGLRQIKFHLNLKDSLNNWSFVNFGLLLYLDLGNCRIQYLESGTFYPISLTLLILDLGGNYLKTLPLGLLTNLLIKPAIIINFENNPWNCDCHLLELQRALVRREIKFHFNILCQEPIEFTKIPIHLANFCGQPDGLTSSYLTRELECRNSLKTFYGKYITIVKKRSKTFGIQRLNDNSINVTIFNEYLPAKSVYVLDGSHSLEYLQSVFALPPLDASSVLIDSRLKQSRVQMICVQGIQLSTTDCATILSPKGEHFQTLNRKYRYAVFVLIIMICLALGTFCGYVFAKKIILLSPV